MSGQSISHYRVLAKLGEGAMGVVYKAEDTKLRRTVALKFLPCDDDELRRRLLIEAQAAASLHHPNICTVFEIDEELGFLAMEFVDGPTLKEKIAERPLKLADALGVLLYEMISGRVPFAGQSEAAVARAILDDDPEPLTALRTKLPLNWIAS
jgi:serine/threonine protein kinase